MYVTKNIAQTATIGKDGVRFIHHFGNQLNNGGEIKNESWWKRRYPTPI